MHLDPPGFRLESGLALWLSLDWQTEKEVILLNFQGWVIGTLEGSIAISRNICSRESKAACKKPDYPEIAKLWLTDGEVAWRDTQPTQMSQTSQSIQVKKPSWTFQPQQMPWKVPRNQTRTKVQDIWPQLSIPITSIHLSHPHMRYQTLWSRDKPSITNVPYLKP